MTSYGCSHIPYPKCSKVQGTCVKRSKCQSRTFLANKYGAIERDGDEDEGDDEGDDDNDDEDEDESEMGEVVVSGV